METTFKVNVVGVNYICDKCKEGGMLYQEGRGRTLLTNPPQFENTRTKCGFKQKLSKKCPTIEYKRV
ncbi:hypothetical protein BK737_05020 [Bacillus thuringiensis serovar palmanyolensis]|nr:hypothetical protein BK737_05020 [Bacillus thuringiensis serovar palmanyolensis]